MVMAMAVGFDTSSVYSSYFAQTAQDALSATGASSLENSLSSINTQTDDEQLMQACKSFESYMVEQIYKGMEKTIMKDEEEENEYLSCFGDTLIQEYARLTTESNSLGLAQQLYDSVKNNT